MNAEELSHVEAAAQFLDCCGDGYFPKARAKAIRTLLSEHNSALGALREEQLKTQKLTYFCEVLIQGLRDTAAHFENTPEVHALITEVESELKKATNPVSALAGEQPTRP